MERRVVTVLFADLVGFTKLCERTDPEDVDRLLRSYYALARSAIEAYGGVVEKFIGDAVAGVFGVPSAHEDDPERAIWAGVRLIDRLQELAGVRQGPPQVRIGVNTGPALVRLDVDPSSGQGFLVGDAVNTAARLQAAAPPMKVVVGELTHDLSARAFQFETVEALTAKGKAEPLRPWLVKAPVARTGIDLTRIFATPLVGREVELGILKGLFEKVVASSSPQFVFITGEAGIGKSRLVFELARHIDTTPGLLATWRQGRALPHGEGVPFWSLSEIVRAHAGIHDSDDRQTAELRLRRSLPQGRDAEWILARLRPLLGIESLPVSQEEYFAAWHRYLKTMARKEPLVLVFDDLHWARPGTLAFLAHLAAHLSGVPALVIAVARPELREDHPTFARGDPWVALDLRALSAGETQRLVGLLAGGAAAEIEAVVAERCGGNPFFTEELVRLLRERSLLEAAPLASVEGAAQTALPDSLNALVAARLDALHPALKAVLANAAIVGQTFWPGVIVAMSDTDRLAVEKHLDELAKREFVRRVHTSSLEGEDEYAFWHGLTREVAYGQLPRGLRAAKHQAVARWIQMAAAEGLSNVAEILAYHYETAYDLACAAGEQELAGRLLAPTVRALWMAGDRALPLDVPLAESHFARAVDRMPSDDSGRPRLLSSWAEALIQSGRLQEAIDTLNQAVEGLQVAGDRRAAAAVMMRLGAALYWHDDRRSRDVRSEAIALLEGDEPSPELVRVLEDWATQLGEDVDLKPAIEAADRVILLASSLGLPEPIRALHSRGMARSELGDEEGLQDMRRALRLAIAQDNGMQTGACFYDLADVLCVFEGPRAAEELRAQGLELAQKRGVRLVTTWLRVQAVQHALWKDEWDCVLDEADQLEALLVEADDPLNLLELRWSEARLLTLRGEAERAEPLAVWAAERGRSHPGNALNCLPSLAAVKLALGEREVALAAIAEVEAISRGRRGAIPYALALMTLTRAAVQAGDPGLCERLLVGVPAERALDSHTVATVEALLTETRGKLEPAVEAYGQAAQRWHDFGAPYEEAQARLGLGRCLLALGRALEAAPPLAEARAIFEKLGAKPALEETRALLSELVNLPG